MRSYIQKLLASLALECFKKEVLLLSANLLKESLLLRKSKRSEAGRQQKAALNDGSHQKDPKRG